MNRFVNKDVSSRARVVVNTLAALTLVRKPDMSRIYEEFKETPFVQENIGVFKSLLDYYERQWIGVLREQRR